jgi:hypothetical protein
MEHFFDDHSDPGLTPEAGLFGHGLGDLSMDPGDQTFFGLLNQAEQGTLPDETTQFADNLTQTVNDTQPQTGEGVNPDAAAALHAFGVADGIQASVADDFYAQQADADAEAALATPDDATGA